MDKKNCHNCIHLDYFDDGYEGPEPGWFCNNREYKTRDLENKHLKQLDDYDYKERPKKCCELRTP